MKHMNLTVMPVRKWRNWRGENIWKHIFKKKKNLCHLNIKQMKVWNKMSVALMYWVQTTATFQIKELYDKDIYIWIQTTGKCEAK